MAKQKKRARAVLTKVRQPEVRKPIFTDEDSNIVPGEVIVQLSADMNAQITESIPTGPSRGYAFPRPRGFGISELDRALGNLNVTSITRLTPPVPTMTTASEEAIALASTFKIRFEGETSVEAVVNILSKVNGVEYAEPNRYRETYAIPNDPSFAAQWGLTRIHCPDAWDRTTGAASVVVAVLDTGIDLDHPELVGLLVPGRDFVDIAPTTLPPPGFHFEGDFIGRDNNPQDEVGHGTHVAGTIACASNNSTGVAGVTWNCRLMPVRVLARVVSNTDATDVRGSGTAADIAAGIRHAVDNGARVLNLSLGGTTDTMVERDAIAYAVGRGAVVVAAMGNGFLPPPNGTNNATSFPAAYPGVVAVGAINQADRRAAFSQTGPHIDVVAPGVGVFSTVWDNGFGTMSGTSMASPHVAGVAALILSCNASLTGAQVADIIRQTAQPLRDNPGDPVPNDNYGFGCVDARAALARACPIIVRSRIIVTCQRSVLLPCPTRQPNILCQRSALIPCPTLQPNALLCQRSALIPCPTQQPNTLCQRSALIPCPTQQSDPRCQRSALIPCPSGRICGIDLSDIAPEDPRLAYGYDQFGLGAEDLTAYDPYAQSYGDEDDMSQLG